MVVSIDLGGRVAIVTGAGSGIGRATSLLLAEAGADVVIPDLNIQGAEATAAEIQKLGRKALPLKVDVSDSNAVNEMVSRTMSEFGKVDILVNNAGIGTKNRLPFYQQEEKEWAGLFDVDVKGVWLCSKAVALEMIKRRSGRIINIASIAGKVALRLQSNYDAAKAGVIKLTEVMALELGEFHINVNCVAPGSTGTEGLNAFRAANPEWAKKMDVYVPFGRTAEPREIGSAVLFLASDLASYMTGSLVVVDGGWTAGAQIRDF
jgi:3-oxoacyl-[acyl-carrier protein] reductase